jgi:predicted ATPase/DNA-binding winged helix-turn-helix (wHTH) protein
MSDHRLLRFGRFTFRMPERTLERDGETVHLGSRAAHILEVLLAEPGGLVKREALQYAVWPETAIDESALRVHIFSLRRALAQGDPQTVYVANVAGRGYRIAVPVETIDDPPPSGRPRPAPLPARLGRVHGRAGIVEELREGLDRERLLSIVGPGGIGKTTVGLSIAAAVAARGTRTYFIDFASVSSGRLVASTVALALDVGVAALDPIPSLAAKLAEEETLLLFDNCEHLVGAVAPVAERLLESAPGLRLLATSREPLAVTGERVHRLAPLAVPPVGVSADQALGFASVRLFADRAAAVWTDFEVGEDNVSFVCDICHRLEGIPLALEFAAARLEAIDIATLANRLEDRFAILTGGRRTALPRHRTLRAMMDWSYDLLDPESGQMLEDLTVFRAGFTLTDAIALTAPASESATAVARIVTLCTKSLLAEERIDGHLVYRLLDTTRHYAAEKLRESGREAAVKRRHARHLGAAMQPSGAPIGSDEQRRTLSRQGRYLDDLRAALDWAFAPEGDGAVGVRLLLGAAFLWFGLSLTEELCGHLERAFLALPGIGLAGSADEVRLRCTLAQAGYHSRWPPEPASLAYVDSLPLAEALGDPALLLEAVATGWLNHSSLGNYPACLDYAERFAVMARPLGPVPMYQANVSMALSQHFMGDHAAAYRSIDAVPFSDADDPDADRFASIVQTDGNVAVLSIKSRALWLLGYPDKALRMCREGTALLRAGAHDLTICTNVGSCFACVALWCGEEDFAWEMVDLLDRSSRHLGAQQWITWVDGYRRVLESDAPLPGPESFFQLETGATLGRPEALVAALAAGRHEERNWSQAELIRRQALTDTGLSSAQQAAAFRQAYELAGRNGERSWQLRAATSLARLGAQEGADLLAETVAGFTEGFATRDLREAAALLGNWASGPHRERRT